MAGNARAPFGDVLAVARRQGERLAIRLGRDVRALVATDPAELSAEMRAFQRAMRRRAEAALAEIEAGGARVIDVVERQLGRASTLVLGRFSPARQGEIEALARRVAALEKRLRAIERRRRAKPRPPAA